MFKKFFLRKKINKNLSKLEQVEYSKTKPVRNIGCLVDARLSEPFKPMFHEIAAAFDVATTNVNILFFNPIGDKDSMFISPKSIDWKGQWRHKAALQFTRQPYDMLINFFKETYSPLGLLSSQVEASFRVGILGLDERLNDLSISHKIEAPEEFVRELVRYTKLIKQ